MTTDHTTAALNAEIARRERAENELAHARELLEHHAADAGWPLKAEIERRERAEVALKRAQEALAFSQEVQAGCEKLMGEMREGLARIAAGMPLDVEDYRSKLSAKVAEVERRLSAADARLAMLSGNEAAIDEACEILRPVSGVAGTGPDALVASAKSAVDRWGKTTAKLQSVADRQRNIIDGRGSAPLHDIDGVDIGRVKWEWKNGEPVLVFPKRYVEHPVRDSGPAIESTGSQVVRREETPRGPRIFVPLGGGEVAIGVESAARLRDELTAAISPRSAEQAKPSFDPSKPDLWLAVCAYAERSRLDARLIQVMRQRRQLGIERYGTPLQPLNGRDAVRDLREELLDAVVYAAQVAVEASGGDAVTTQTGAVAALGTSGAFNRVLDVAHSVIVGWSEP